MSRPSAIVVGSVNVDIVMRVAALPAPGETVLSSHMVRMPGGKGANQAAALSRLGASVLLVGAVGNDDAGEWSIAELRSAGVDVSAVLSLADVSTGTAVVVVDDRGENSIVVAPGANRMAPAPSATAVARCDVVLAQLEIPIDVVVKVGQLTRSAGVPFVLNAAPAAEIPRSLLRQVDVLIVNEGELAAVSGHRRGPIRARAEELLVSGPGAVVVTMGPKGCLVATTDETIEVDAPVVAVMDTTGAGDCFGAAFAYGVAAGWSITQSAKVAVTAGSLAVGVAGARAPLPPADEIAASPIAGAMTVRVSRA